MVERVKRRFGRWRNVKQAASRGGSCNCTDGSQGFHISTGEPGVSADEPHGSKDGECTGECRCHGQVAATFGPDTVTSVGCINDNGGGSGSGGGSSAAAADGDKDDCRSQVSASRHPPRQGWRWRSNSDACSGTRKHGNPAITGHGVSARKLVSRHGRSGDGCQRGCTRCCDDYNRNSSGSPRACEDNVAQAQPSRRSSREGEGASRARERDEQCTGHKSGHG